MNETELKEWLRNNLRLSVDYRSYDDNDVEVGLYFEGECWGREPACFTSAFIHIPRDD